MIFQVRFGSAQLVVAYQFYDSTGTLIGSSTTVGVDTAPETGTYFVSTTPPVNAIGIYWFCADPTFTASEIFVKPFFQVRFGSAQTSVEYQFYDATGALIASPVTTGIYAGPEVGSYIAAAVPPTNSIGIYWSCADPNFIASETFVMPVVPSGTPIPVNTVELKYIIDSVLRRLGADPFKENSYDKTYSIISHLNRRLKYVWRALEWPELRVVEQRAFRTTWKTWIAFGVGDEFYDPTSDAYYTTIVDAPTGTLPTNTTYFTPETITDRYIELDQEGQNEIDEVVLVYPNDPTLTRSTPTIPFNISSRGIQVHTGCNTVWVLYKLPPSKFTARPKLDGVTYGLGDSYYDVDRENCFRIVQDTVTGNNVEQLIPVPEFLESYLVPMVYGDCLMESSPQGYVDHQIKMAAAGAAYAEAQDYITSEIDRLIRQGYANEYPAFRLRRHHRNHHPEELTLIVPGS